MKVAPTYQKNYTIISEKFMENGKWYVTIKHNKTGNERKARYYSDIDYKKLYEPKEEKPAEIIISRPPGTQKKALGFDKGYITVLKGNAYPYKEWLKEIGARYARTWGWYIVSTMKEPDSYPSLLEPVKITWELVGTADGYLKPEDELNAILGPILYGDHPSKHVGEVGQRSTFNLRVDRVVESYNQWGDTFFHVLSDENDNVFIWSTGNVKLEEGNEYQITGTIKKHDIFRNIKQTVITRCKIVEE